MEGRSEEEGAGGGAEGGGAPCKEAGGEEGGLDLEGAEAALLRECAAAWSVGEGGAEAALLRECVEALQRNNRRLANKQVAPGARAHHAQGPLHSIRAPARVNVKQRVQ